MDEQAANNNNKKFTFKPRLKQTNKPTNKQTLEQRCFDLGPVVALLVGPPGLAFAAVAGSVVRFLKHP